MTKRDFLFVGCQGGHDMKHIGGRNAACAPDCACSIPVRTCTRCKACDYGENQEARQIIAKCAEDWCACGRGATDHEEPCCNYAGLCEAAPDARSITNCIHCGKELHERNGQWWTWDADWSDSPRLQGYIT